MKRLLCKKNKEYINSLVSLCLAVAAAPLRNQSKSPSRPNPCRSASYVLTATRDASLAYNRPHLLSPATPTSERKAN